MPASSHYNSRTNGRWIRARPSSFINIPRREYTHVFARADALHANYAPRVIAASCFVPVLPRLRCELGELSSVNSVEAGNILLKPAGFTSMTVDLSLTNYAEYAEDRLRRRIWEFRRIFSKFGMLKYS